MIRLTNVMEEQIRAAMREYETATGGDRERYGERLLAKLDFALELGKNTGDGYIDGMPRIIIDDRGMTYQEDDKKQALTPPLDPSVIKTGAFDQQITMPELKDTRPMSQEDINNVELVVKKKAEKKTGRPTKEEKEKNIAEVKNLMKAGKDLKEIAAETGRTREAVQSDMRWIQSQEAK